jgi:hypothetical protein
MSCGTLKISPLVKFSPKNLREKAAMISHEWWTFEVFRNVIYPHISLMGQCQEIFDPRFFHQTIPFRTVIHGLKPFRIWIRIRRENRDNRLKKSDSAVSMTPRDQIRRCQWYRGVIEAAGSDSLWHRGIIHVNDNWIPFPLRGNHSKKK